MFQYPSSYITPSMTYAFLPSMGYQLCYLSQKQLLILPQNCFDSPCYSAPQTPSEPEDRLISKTLAMESPKAVRTGTKIPPALGMLVTSSDATLDDSSACTPPNAHRLSTSQGNGTSSSTDPLVRINPAPTIPPTPTAAAKANPRRLSNLPSVDGVWVTVQSDHDY